MLSKSEGALNRLYVVLLALALELAPTASLSQPASSVVPSSSARTALERRNLWLFFI